MSDVKIQIKDNGPFLVQGNVSVVDAEGKEFKAEGKAIPLCRCGTSTNQPFCTGDHRKAGFESAPRVSE